MVMAWSLGVQARERVCFDENWKFHLGHAIDSQKDFNYRTTRLYGKTAENYGTCIEPKFDDSGWRQVDLPHDWAVELPFDRAADMSHGYKPVGQYYPQNSIGWYRKTFAMPSYGESDRVSLTFDGVFRNSQVWVNNFYLGNNFSGYTSFTYDITDFVHPGEDNVVVVRVDASQIEGWFYEGAGIYRHVWLDIYDNVHFVDNGIFVSSSLNEDMTSAKVNVGVEIENWTNEQSDVSVAAVVKDNKGNIVACSGKTGVKFDDDGRGKTSIGLEVKNPRLWDVESPHLYRVETVISSGEKVYDRVETKFGIREIVFDKDKGLFLNRKPIKIKGVCCHQDHAGVGSAIPDFLYYYRISLLKEMGANAYRCSHNPPAPEVLDACDSLGLLVVDETRLTNSGKEYMQQWESLILRDRNHPSIFMWSIGNEEETLQSRPEGKRIASSMMRRLRQLDNTRPATYGANNGGVTEGINEVIDVRGFNYNLGGVDPYRKARPDQPMYGSEVGSTVTTRGVFHADSVKNYLTDYDENFPPWASTAETWWTMASGRDWFMGGFVWTGFDYRGEPTPLGWPNVNSHFGVMDMCGFPKNVYWYYRTWWTDEDILHIAPHWNHHEGDTVRVWVNSNAEAVSLSLNGKNLGKKEMPENGHLLWKVPYKAGKLKAVAYKDGRRFEKTVETTAEPVSIVLVPYKSVVTADGKDGTVINVEVRDKKGRPVQTARNMIYFKLEGDADIIGVGNGDPSCHEKDKCPDVNWSRSLFNGRCQLILQAGKSVGDIKVVASADGLRPAEIVIRQQ